jgi:acyl dehydratase
VTTKYLEDFKVGDVLETHGRTVTEADVVNFAGLTGDIHPLHMDEVYARSTRYGRRLPHGQLIFALSLGLAERVIEPLMRDSIIAFYGVDRLRFLHPVFIGDTIRLHRIVENVQAKEKDTGLLTFADNIRNQDGELCVVYYPKYLLRRRP